MYEYAGTQNMEHECVYNVMVKVHVGDHAVLMMSPVKA